MKNTEKTVFLCVGGDARQTYMCRYLSNYGRVYSYGIGATDGVFQLSRLENMEEKADVLVLPMMTQKGLKINCDNPGENKNILCSETVPYLKKNALVTGGRLSTKVIEYYSALGFDVTDYFNREELILKNCIPTAEGTLQIAMQELGITIFGCKTLVIGYGRVGRATAELFKSVGAETTVCARRLASLAQAENSGCETMDLRELFPLINKFDLVINTVPSKILDSEILSAVGKDTLIIDLASKPGGVDFEYAKNHNKKVIHALALPGKSAPITAGKIIAGTVINIIRERGKKYV